MGPSVLTRFPIIGHLDFGSKMQNVSDRLVWMNSPIMVLHCFSCILGTANGCLMEVCVDSVESAINAERGGKRY